jgi:hypothetical protein
LNVTQDMTLAPSLQKAAYRQDKGEASASSLDDLSDSAGTLLDSAAPDLAPPPAPARASAPNPAAAPTSEIAESEGVPVPDLMGKPMRGVLEECFRLGLTPSLIGTGLAVEQVPEAGTLVRRGSHVTVKFARAAEPKPAASRQRK